MPRNAEIAERWAQGGSCSVPDFWWIPRWAGQEGSSFQHCRWAAASWIRLESKRPTKKSDDLKWDKMVACKINLPFLFFFFCLLSFCLLLLLLLLLLFLGPLPRRMEVPRLGVESEL